MKIIQLMAGDEEGGMEKHVVELTNALAAAGDSLSLIAHPKYATRVDQRVSFVPLDLTRSRRNPIMLWQLLRIIRKRNPDVIHAQGGKAMDSLARLKRWLPMPLVGTVHNRKRRHRGIGAFSVIVTVSRGLAEAISHPRVEIVYNGIANAPGTAASEPLAADYWTGCWAGSAARRWLAVGRLVPAKGFDTLVEAFASVVDGHLLIAGDGPQLETLNRLIREKSLTDRISLLGHRNDIPRLMNACDALVIASRREGFSYVFAEALMQGVPVVSTDVPIPNEVLPAELICPPDDPQALARLINGLDPSARCHGDARAFAREQLTIAAMVDRTRLVYRNAVAARA